MGLIDQSLEQMTHSELKDMASELEINYPKTANSKALIKLISENINNGGELSEDETLPALPVEPVEPVPQATVEPDLPPVPDVKITPEQVAETNQVVVTAKAAKERMVRIIVAKTETNKNPLSLNVGNRQMWIPRGVEVLLPEGMMPSLELATKWVYDEKGRQSEVPSHPYTVKGYS